jgi:hypothetical protein
MSLRELITRWLERRADYERTGALVNGARIIEEFIGDLNVATKADAGRLLTLKAASQESGYSTDHLARLVRKGAIPNAGKPNAPRIRAEDLPRRVGRFDHSGHCSYDVNADARSLGVRR